jgi:hypothetical protein
VTSVYGRIVTGMDVRAAAQATLERWLPSYLAEMQRQKNLTLPPVRHYSTGIDPATPADKLPGVVLVAPGITGTPERRGAGVYDAWWALGVGVVVAHELRDTACLWAETYTGAIKACLVQQKSLGGFAADLEWVDEEVTQADWNTTYSVWAGALEFTVLVPAVLDSSGGLASPPVAGRDGGGADRPGVLDACDYYPYALTCDLRRLS